MWILGTININKIFESRVGQDDSEQRGYNAQRHQEEDADRCVTADAFIILGTVILGYDDSVAARETYRDRKEKKSEASGRADCGQRVLTCELTYDDRIGGVIELLQ